MIRKTCMFASVAATLTLGAVLGLTAPALAAETTYTLTYPDGSVVTTTDKAEAEQLEGEWKLLYSGETDEAGDIVLEGWAESGEIMVVEAEVPEGYTAETTETTADLADGEVTIVNTKVTEPEPTKPAKKTPAKKASAKRLPKTDDLANPRLWALVAGVGVGVAAAGIYVKKRKSSK